MNILSRMQLPEIKGEVLVRELGIVTLKQVTQEYMIANGMHMGRWTSHFGSHCIADTPDCKGYIRVRQEEFPGSEILECSLKQVDK